MFYAALWISLMTEKFAALALLCGPILAVLFAFAALLYNRARALPDGKELRRSLYAAERSLQATTLFMVGTALGGVGAGVTIPRQSRGL